MRGADDGQVGIFSYVSLESRVPAGHPLRAVRRLVDAALAELDRDFEALYQLSGRRSVAPERLHEGDIACKFFDAVLAQARAAGLTSDEHFSVDGTLVDAWASHKGFRRKGGGDDDNPDRPGRNAGRNFHGERRSNDTHASTTDPEARMYRKSFAHPARLCYAGHALMENRNGLMVDTELTAANGRVERSAALAMLARVPGNHPVTLGADKAYDTRDCIDGVRAWRATPHVAQVLTRRRGSAIDARTTRHPGYTASQRIRKRIEEAFGWTKQIGPIRKTKLRARDRVGFQYVLTMAAYNLVRVRRLMAEAPA